MSDRMIIKSRFKDYTVNFINDFLIPFENEKKNGSFFIVDSNVHRLYLEKAEDVLPTDIYLIIKANERNKTIDKCKEIVEVLVEKQIRRNQRLVAIGGGVIQDITAFTASIIYRGIEWSFFPTTLLAQADSCIGSKTSINLGDKKNIIGNFYPPSDIFLDVRFLNKLPSDDIKSGIGEILHFYFYSNSPFIQEMMNRYNDLIANPKLLMKFIRESLAIKKSVIEIDEFDKGERNKFNYGHTFGHAIETVTNYELKHGQAVCLGMDIANYLSLNFGLLNDDLFNEMHVIIKTNIPDYDWSGFDLCYYIDALSKDKKNIGNKLGCILSKGPGDLVKKQIPFDKNLKTLISQYFQEVVYS